MKIKFSIKLFLIFLLFGILLFIPLSYFEYQITKKQKKENSIKEFIFDTTKVAYTLDEVKTEAKNAINSIFALESLEKEEKEALYPYLDLIIKTHKKFLQISILDENLNYIIDVKKEKENKKTELNLQTLTKLKENVLEISSIEPRVENQEIQIPLVYTLKIMKKIKSHIVIVFVNINDLIKSLNRIFYIADQNRDIIYDKSGIYNWSKYYYSDLDTQKLIPAFKNLNMKENLSLKNEYIYKKVLLNRSNSLFLIGKTEVLDLKSFIENFFYEFTLLFFLVVFLCFILSIFFTLPLSNINRKLKEEKKSIYDSFEEKKGILDESLDIIDEHLMYLKIDKDHNIEDVSHYFCQIYGYEKEELIGQPCSILYSNKIYEELKREVFSILENKKEWQGEVLTQKKNKDEYWVNSHVKVEFEGEKVLSYKVVRRDISDNKRVEKLYENLSYQIEQQNIIFQNVYSGIALIDLEGKIKKANLSFSKIFAYNQDEIVLKSLFTLVEKRSKELLQRVLNEAKKSGSVTNVELIFLTKNSKEIYLELSVKMLPEGKNLVLAVNSLEDKRKLQELNLNLEQRVKEEVRKNIEKDRVHQEERLKNVKLTSIGTLAAGITHEINTPLTYLKGNFEMLQMDIDELKDESLKNEMKNSCSKISDAINRIAVIVESMREMSQSSSEAKEKTNIFATLVTSLTMAYNISKQISKIKLNSKEFKLTNIQKEDFEIFAKVQKQRLEQVWVIIINNALDELKNIENYENRELNIDIFKENGEVVVRFSDNAGGIKKEILSRIFEPFTSSKTHSGMGIGLNIAKKIVEEQEGKIEAYNRQNSAIFEVKLKALD
ncbi:PAS domain-containing sensor histidine kinase [Halarcobacter anaerophilus]|uniref:histidine kinase n=1 Tax=Halarcobacter anaerophilus TaxID=877500 RepID=A0A4Q0Y1F0_9BACT|nr:PAS domain-containing sensor histidine kinase [Halarcobacter anaerophilus]QDF28103.1 PAS sensor-containing two-component system histidine kinase [Halarcobacter anaerophilus]RXJ62449.1 PAS domain-containing sensor histidine kinase [Halarcobacter anaerophilus]